ncbi:erythromycin esterase family protein [Actinomycetospora straminea]|uniref:erythromycin esterase family protein n=1 Tax=Actinomycetospora straminea TaxID=663607 RepID=UPI0023666A11|nr:erythromycin esterase family protein [Actinomycetospora straminea]MDD7930974.1 erythromycin esterase family protein [Actinomycetospora straminea]
MSAPPTELSRALAAHARPLGVPDDLPDGEPTEEGLAAWVRAARGARVVALGPAVGGTRELAALAGRCVEELVADAGAGVGTLALQAAESGTTVLDDHVRQGTGNAGGFGEALQGLGSWSWHTREVLDVVRALASRGGVRVVGIDPRRPAPAVRVVGAFLRAAAPDALPPVADGLADLALGYGDGEGTRAAVEQVRERLARDVPALVAATSPTRHAEAVRHAGFLARAAELAATPPERAEAVAARLMADAVLDALDSQDQGDRLVLWAHADHVVVREQTLGAHLRERLGDGYRTLVLSAGTGTVRATRRRRLFGPTRTPATHRLGEVPASSLEGVLLDALPRDAVLDLRDPAVPPAVTAWAGEATVRRSVGDEVSAAAPARATVPCVPGTELDGVAVVRAVHPARAL